MEIFDLLPNFQPITSQLCSWNFRAEMWLVDRFVEGRNFRRTIIWQSVRKKVEELGFQCYNYISVAFLNISYKCNKIKLYTQNRILLIAYLISVTFSREIAETKLTSNGIRKSWRNYYTRFSTSFKIS